MRRSLRKILISASFSPRLDGQRAVILGISSTHFWPGANTKQETLTPFEDLHRLKQCCGGRSPPHVLSGTFLATQKGADCNAAVSEAVAMRRFC
jgi:hypothetical protein